MKKRLVVAFILIAYVAILIKVMVFKDIPLVRVGQLMLNFGGTDGGHPANFVPLKTILPYLFGYKGLIIAGINIVGNIILLVPLGFLVPLVYPNITWKKSLILAAAAGLCIEIMQVLLHVGIFDIDDVILNALGVMIGFWIFIILAKWIREKKYKTMIATVISAVAAAALFYGAVVYPISHQPVVTPEVGARGDLCGGTGGNGQIVSVGNNKFNIELKDGRIQTINLTTQATIKTSAGPASPSDLKIGDRVTLVGDVNPDGSFTAGAVFVCN